MSPHLLGILPRRLGAAAPADQLLAPSARSLRFMPSSAVPAEDTPRAPLDRGGPHGHLSPQTATALVPLPSRESAEGDEADQRHDQPGPEAPNDRHDDSRDHEDATERYSTDCSAALSSPLLPPLRLLRRACRGHAWYPGRTRVLRNWPLGVLPLVALARHCKVGVHARSVAAPGQSRRPRRGASAARRFAADREQRGTALGAVALPAGTTVGQGHFPGVGDGDLLAADTPGLRAGVPVSSAASSTQPWPPSIFAARVPFMRGAARNHAGVNNDAGGHSALASRRRRRLFQRMTARRWPRWRPLSGSSSKAPKKVEVRRRRAAHSGSRGSSSRQRVATRAIA